MNEKDGWGDRLLDSVEPFTFKLDGMFCFSVSSQTSSISSRLETTQDPGICTRRKRKSPANFLK